MDPSFWIDSCVQIISFRLWNRSCWYSLVEEMVLGLEHLHYSQSWAILHQMYGQLWRHVCIIWICPDVSIVKNASSISRITEQTGHVKRSMTITFAIRGLVCPLGQTFCCKLLWSFNVHGTSLSVISGVKKANANGANSPWQVSPEPIHLQKPLGHRHLTSIEVRLELLSISRRKLL